MVIPCPTYFQLLLEFIRGVYCPQHFSALVWTGFWGRCRRAQSAVHHLGMSKSLTLISQMIVIFAGTLRILLGALEVLNEGSEPLGLWVSLVITKIQSFNDILDAAILSVPVCGKDVEVT